MSKEIKIPFTQIRIGRFYFLLISIVLMFALKPFLEDSIGIQLLMDIFVTLILLSGVYAAGQKNYLFYIALLITTPTITLHWLSYFVAIPSSIIAQEIFGVIFFTFLTVIILVYLCKEKQVTSDVIAGAICGYFLIGLMWASFYAILESLQPGSFSIPEHISKESSSFTYYSYVTLTTLGFGDITPITNQARSLSILEAIMGPIYLAILVARLVAMQITQSMRKESS